MERERLRELERRYGVLLSGVEIRQVPTLSSWANIREGKIVVNISPVERILRREKEARVHEITHAVQITRLLRAGGERALKQAFRRPGIYEIHANYEEMRLNTRWGKLLKALSWIFPPYGYALHKYSGLFKDLEEMGVGIYPERFYKLRKYAHRRFRSLKYAEKALDIFMRFSSWLAERGWK